MRRRELSCGESSWNATARCRSFVIRLTSSPRFCGEESPDNAGNHTSRKGRRVQRDVTDSATEI